MVNEQLPWLKPSIQQDQPGLAWRDQMNTDGHRVVSCQERGEGDADWGG
jgi:hypothetical protein